MQMKKMMFLFFFYFSSIGELVKEGENGVLFSDSFELTEQLMKLFKNFPNSVPEMEVLQAGAKDFALNGKRWSSEWENKVLPLVERL
jgi:beta-1,4-mannosyltransferase